MKTIKQLREDTVGIVTNVVDPAGLRNIRNLTGQVSDIYHSTVFDALKKIEHELVKFGYTLGDIEIDGDLGDEGEAFLAVHSFPSRELVKNLYLTIKWEKLASGQQYQYRQEGSALNFRVTVLTYEATPETLQKIIDSQLDGYVYFDTP